MTNFIFEILSEEIPAMMQKNAAENFGKIALEVLTKNNLALQANQVQSFVTPRRLTLIVSNLKVAQEIPAVKRVGPKIDADKKAVAGFLKSCGLQDESQLEQVENNGARCFAFTSQASQLKTVDILRNSLPAIVQKMTSSWPKLMRYDVFGAKEQAKWIRPVRNILALFGSEIIECEFFGLKSNNLTYGHFLKSNQALVIKDVQDYEKTLEENLVILNQQKRKQTIIEQVTKIITSLDLVTIDDVEKSALFDEINGLCEWPTAMLAEIDNKFMDLPEEVLILTLKLNQRYLCLRDKNGDLAAKFIFIANAIDAENNAAKIIHDNERLVHARLSDAQFFISEDLKKPLIERLDALKQVVFHKKLGSVYDKTQRLNQLTRFLSIFVPHCDLALAKRAADLCKADLVTKTVAELPELQGKVGSFYAQKQHENPKVAAAIYEHYLPQGLGVESPKTSLGVALAISDKIDTIVGFFLADEKPTSSKDPYALRRSALGIIRIGFEHNIAFPIRILVQKSLAAYQPKLVKSLLQNDEIKFDQMKKKLEEEIVRFFVERLKFYLRENEMLRADIVNVVIDTYLENLDAHKTCDILYLAEKIRFLDSFVTNAENRNIVELYKRSANILAIEEKKDGKKYGGKILPLSLKNKYEKVLHQRIKQIAPDFKKLVTKGDFSAAFKLLHILEVPLTHFFEHLIVNDKDENVRHTRLLILAKIRALFSEVADLSKIELGV